jgi:hypothetical protein
MFTCEGRAGRQCGAGAAKYPADTGRLARPQRFAAAAIVGLAALAWAAPAAAYRPFDGTDAAVADKDEVEIELQPAGELRANSRSTLAGPYAIVSYGFADRWQLVLQGAGQAPPPDAGPISVANAALLKYIVQPGALQEKSGPSIATEFGALLPDIGGSGVGVSWAGIMSQRWDWGTVHFNVATNLTPDHHGELFVSTIIEGPNKWTVRPVFELYSDSVANQSQTYSDLAGVIWRVNDKLSFDVAVRHALVNGRPVDEVRAGLTFGFSLNFGKPSGAESVNTPLIGRR